MLYSILAWKKTYENRIETMSRSSSASKPKSIRLQIDLPVDDDHDEAVNRTPRNNIIHLHINIDQKGRLSTRGGSRTNAKFTGVGDTTTSGYSSSSGLSSSSSTHSLNSTSSSIGEVTPLPADSSVNCSDLVADRAFSLYPKPMPETTKLQPNFYDRLSYVPATQQVTNKPNLRIDSNEKVDKEKAEINNFDNIYEEISSFLESNGHIYVNQLKPITKLVNYTNKGNK